MKNKVRPIRIEGDVAYVTLTKGYTAIIDAEDAVTVGMYNWTALVGPKTVYGYRNSKDSSGKQKTTYLHRFITNAPSSRDVDHIDHNGLNNTKNNLRLCSHAQNLCNSRIQKTTSVGTRAFFGTSDTKGGRPISA